MSSEIRGAEGKVMENQKQTPQSGLQISGNIGLDQDGVIRATVKGDIRSANKLVIAKESVVSGVVSARDVRLEGRVDGGIEGSGQVWLVSGSVLRTRCVAKALRIDPGSVFTGELRVGE
jgi:cytoskeletal protein CcmA (bactofilin family)